MKYPTLEFEIQKRGIKKSTIANTLNITTRCLYNKLNGNTAISWPEACKIQEIFFPDLSKDTLFIPTSKDPYAS